MHHILCYCLWWYREADFFYDIVYVGIGSLFCCSFFNMTVCTEMLIISFLIGTSPGCQDSKRNDLSRPMLHDIRWYSGYGPVYCRLSRNLPTPYVTPATVAYIHGLIIDSVTANPTDSATQRALQCENMARQEVESMTLAVFHNELRIAMTSYY